MPKKRVLNENVLSSVKHIAGIVFIIIHELFLSRSQGHDNYYILRWPSAFSVALQTEQMGLLSETRV